MLKEIGYPGQKKLSEAKVMIVGLGGLGSPVCLYLAASGIGELGIMDSDIIDYSNLQRQVLYNSSDIGKSKSAVAKTKINELNPICKVTQYEERLSEKNVCNIFDNYDLIVDCTDNLPTRYLINHACKILKKTYIFGSIQNFEGMVTVFQGGKGPCYRCLFEQPPKEEFVPGILEKGVLGVLPGVIGCIQATEVIKLLCGIGEPLIEKMLVYDALSMEFCTYNYDVNINCPICSGELKLSSYKEEKDVIDIEIIEHYNFLLKEIMLIDVREESEFNKYHLENSINIPIFSLAQAYKNLDINKSLILTSECNERSLLAAYFLKQKLDLFVCVLDSDNLDNIKPDL